MGTLRKKPTPRRDREDAARLQAQGQHGDTVLAHINPQEARLLDYLADRKIDAPRNPKTGLLSFGMSDAEGPSGHDSNPGGVGGGPAGGNTGGGIGGNTAGGLGGEGGGYNGSTVNGYGGYADLGGYISGLVQAPYDPVRTPIESLLAAPNFAPPGMSFTQYSPPDTLSRLAETYLYGPPPSYTARGKVPGNLGMPNALGPGIFGKAATMFAGNPMSAAMNLGMHMDQAMSPESRARSMAENQATGAKNSTGQDRSTQIALNAEELRRATPGARSGAQTEAAPVAPPGYTINAAGQIVPVSSRNSRPGHQDAIRNLLYDYIWRGPSGRGWA